MRGRWVHLFAVRVIRMRKKMRKGQSVLEYALLFSAVAAVFVTAQVYLRRAVNANIHTFQEQLDEKPN